MIYPCISASLFHAPKIEDIFNGADLLTFRHSDSPGTRFGYEQPTISPYDAEEGQTALQ